MQIIIDVNNKDLIYNIIDHFSEISDISSFCSSKEDIMNNMEINLYDFSGITIYDFDKISIAGFDTFKDELKQEIKKRKIEELEEELKW